MSLLMIHEAYMPVYIGSRFSLRRTGPPEVVQEALADLKKYQATIVNVCVCVISENCLGTSK